MKCNHFSAISKAVNIMTSVQGSLTQFELPKNILVIGSSQAAKRFFEKNFLLHHEEMFKPRVSKIMYCFSIWQDKYEELEASLCDLIEFRTDIPTKDELVHIWQNTKGETLLVLDDKMSSSEDNAITVTSHAL